MNIDALKNLQATLANSDTVAYLAALVQQDITRLEAPDVVPVDPPKTGATLKMLNVKKWDGDSILVEFGFDKNRFGRLEVENTTSDDDAKMTSDADTTGNWGAEGREHNQWLRDLPRGSKLLVYAQTSDDGKEWFDVGDPLEVNTAPMKKASAGYALDMSTGATLKSLFEKDSVYANDTGTRIDISDGVLMQRYDPTSKGSYHDQAAARIESGHRVYTVEQSVKFASDFTPVLGGKFGFGLIGGNEETVSGGDIDPSGWSATPMFRPSKVKDCVDVVLYTYQANRKKALPYGDDNHIATLKLGQWYDIKFVIGLNSDPSKSDGYMLGYLDGKLVMEVRGVQWQGKGKPGENMRFEYKAFFGGSGPKFAAKKPQYSWSKKVSAAWSDQ